MFSKTGKAHANFIRCKRAVDLPKFEYSYKKITDRLFLLSRNHKSNRWPSSGWSWEIAKEVTPLSLRSVRLFVGKLPTIIKPRWCTAQWTMVHRYGGRKTVLCCHIKHDHNFMSRTTAKCTALVFKRSTRFTKLNSNAVNRCKINNSFAWWIKYLGLFSL